MPAKPQQMVEFECPVCLEEYSSQYKPKILPCGHTVCDSCLRGMKNRVNKIECPSCRKQHEVDVESLMVNYVLIRVVQKKDEKPQNECWDMIVKILQQIGYIQKFQKDLKVDKEEGERIIQRSYSYLQTISIIEEKMRRDRQKITKRIQIAQNKNQVNFIKSWEVLENQKKKREKILEELKSAYSNKFQPSIDCKFQASNLKQIQKPIVKFMTEHELTEDIQKIIKKLVDDLTYFSIQRVLNSNNPLFDNHQIIEQAKKKSSQLGQYGNIQQQIQVPVEFPPDYNQPPVLQSSSSVKDFRRRQSFSDNPRAQSRQKAREPEINYGFLDNFGKQVWFSPHFQRIIQQGLNRKEPII